MTALHGQSLCSLAQILTCVAELHGPMTPFSKFWLPVSPDSSVSDQEQVVRAQRWDPSDDP